MLFKFALRERSRDHGITRVAVFVKEPVAAFLWKYRCAAASALYIPGSAGRCLRFEALPGSHGSLQLEHHPLPVMLAQV